MKWIKWYLKGFINMFYVIGTLLLGVTLFFVIFTGIILTSVLAFGMISPNELAIIHKVILVLYIPCLALLFTQHY